MIWLIGKGVIEVIRSRFQTLIAFMLWLFVAFDRVGAQSENPKVIAGQEMAERLNELETENVQLQQEVIRLRSMSLQKQASLRLREQIVAGYAEQTESMPTAQLNLLDQRKRLIAAVRSAQTEVSPEKRGAGYGKFLSAIGLGMASSNANNSVDALADALAAYSISLSSSSSSYLQEI